MNSNYDWQKHQTNARIQARFAEAEIHRSLKHSNNERKHTFRLFSSIILLPAAGMAALLRRRMSQGRSGKPQSIHNV